MRNIAVFGAGGMGREVKMLIDQINKQAEQWNFIGFFDDGIQKGQIVNGYPVLGGIDELNAYEQPLAIAMGIGYSNIRKMIVDKIANLNISYPTLIHPNVQLGNDDVKIGEGCIISAGCVITVNISIGDFVLFNWCCTVGHDTIVDNYCSFMPSVNISGGVKIGSGVFVGTGANIINHLTIGANTTIGAGAVVTKSVPANCTAVGIPAQPIKFNNL